MKKSQTSLSFITLTVIIFLFSLNSVTTFAFTENKHLTCSLIPQLSEEKLIGNWINVNKNEWIYGFFEDFVIYESKFWKYETIHKNKNTLLISLIHGKEKLELKIKLHPKEQNIIQVASGKEKYIQFEKVISSTLPPYKTPDTEKFFDNGYKIDTARISGYCRTNNNNIEVSISFWNFLMDEEENFQTTLDEHGWFELKFPLLNTTQVYFSLENPKQVLVTAMEAGENIFLFYDESHKQFLVMGENARFHNENIQYTDSPYHYADISYNANLSHEEYFDRWKKTYDKNIKTLEEYANTYSGELSYRFTEFQTKKLYST